MTFFTQNRIFPFLFVVIVLAFSVRCAELITGVSALSHQAFAEEKAPDPAKKSEEKTPPPNDTKATESKGKTGKNTEGKEGKPEKAEEKKEEAKDSDAMPWRDAADEAEECTDVKKDVFDDLAKRRKALEQRDKEMATREALLKAAGQELDRKYQELSQLRTQIETLLDKQSEEEQARAKSLVKIYEGMKPKEAARIFDTLDLDVLVSVVSKMSERKLSPVLAAMSPERAKTVTIMLSEEKKLPELPPDN